MPPNVMPFDTRKLVVPVIQAIQGDGPFLSSELIISRTLDIVALY